MNWPCIFSYIFRSRTSPFTLSLLNFPEPYFFDHLLDGGDLGEMQFDVAGPAFDRANRDRHIVAQARHQVQQLEFFNVSELTARNA